MAVPQSQPRLEMGFRELEREVARGHAAAVECGAAAEAGPKSGDLFQVCRPVFNVRGKDRTDYVMLTDIRVKSAEQEREAGFASDAVIE